MKRYLPLKSQSSRLGDQYYKCLNENLTRRNPRSIEECLKIGREYYMALQKQLEDLERFSDTGFVEHERKLVSRYMNLIEHDLNSLTQGEIDKLRSRTRPQFDQ